MASNTDGSMDSNTDSDFDEESDGPPPPPRKKSTRARRVNYNEEHVDTFFSDLKGYTNFQRTRKGGDKRPFAAGAEVYNINNNILYIILIIL